MALNFGSGNLFTTQANTEGFGKIPKGLFDWAVHGTRFIPLSAGNTIVTTATYAFTGVGDNAAFTGICPINLPHGVTIVSAIVHGNDGTDNWILVRVALPWGSAAETIASGATNAEDFSIITPLVDNNRYAYYFLATMAGGQSIKAARVTYDQ